MIIPLIADELEIRKELVEQVTVRLTKSGQERPEIIREFLASEHFEIERVPMDEVVTMAPAVRMEGDVIVIPIIKEILVVKKELLLREELRLVKKRVAKEFLQETTLRREELTKPSPELILGLSGLAKARLLLSVSRGRLAYWRKTTSAAYGCQINCSVSTSAGAVPNAFLPLTEGLLITLRRSKTNQEGQGREVAIPHGAHEVLGHSLRAGFVAGRRTVH